MDNKTSLQELIKGYQRILKKITTFPCLYKKSLGDCLERKDGPLCLICYVKREFNNLESQEEEKKDEN